MVARFAGAEVFGNHTEFESPFNLSIGPTLILGLGLVGTHATIA